MKKRISKGLVLGLTASMLMGVVFGGVDLSKVYAAEVDDEVVIGAEKFDDIEETAIEAVEINDSEDSVILDETDFSTSGDRDYEAQILSENVSSKSSDIMELSDDDSRNEDVEVEEDLDDEIVAHTLNAYQVSNESSLNSALEAGGDVQLSANITCTSDIYIKCAVRIDLNGYTIDLDEVNKILIYEDLVIEGGGKIVGDIEILNGDLTLKEGILRGEFSSTVEINNENSTFNMEGGTIISPIDGRACIDVTKGYYNMVGGEVCGNQDDDESDRGPGIYCCSYEGRGKVTIKGGSIHGFETGVYISGINGDYSLSMSEGSIYDCKYGIYSEDDIEDGVAIGSVNIDGGNILNCEYGLYLDGEAMINGGSIHDNDVGVYCNSDVSTILKMTAGKIVNNRGEGMNVGGGDMSVKISGGEISQNGDCGVKIGGLVVVDITGGKITNNRGNGVYFTGAQENDTGMRNGILRISGSPYIYGNEYGISWYDTTLENTNIVVAGTLNKDAKVSVIRKIGNDFTEGYKNYNNTIDPGSIFFWGDGDGDYKANLNNSTGEVQFSKRITPISQKITKAVPKTASIVSGQSTTTTITGTNIKGKKFFSSSNTNIATINSSGKITGKKPGKAKISVYVNATGNYTKSNTASFNITVKKPATPTLSSVKGSKQSAVVKWKKATCNGYLIEYATDKAFKKNKKTLTVKGGTKTSATIKNLKKGKTYYIRMYAYGSSTNVKSGASKAKSVKCK